MNCLTRISTPQLVKLHSGKVRESFRIDASTRMIVVTDRLSAFDRVLDTPIPNKGAILNGIANFWFDKTSDICPNHFLKSIDPNISLVREAVPVKVEMVVRGYLSGSAWRGYEAGKRHFSGVTLPDGLTKNQKLPEPILTPTTKEASDREITPGEIVSTGLATHETYRCMAETALKLFRRGTEHLAAQGLLLADTKYEFGLIGDELVLIDEIHTPDSSRFWSKSSYEANPETVDSFDKEYVRSWLREHAVGGELPPALSEEATRETARIYTDIFRRITGSDVTPCVEDIGARICRNLCESGIIKQGYVVIFMGSPADADHARTIASHIEPYGIKCDLRVVSAHKNGERISEIAAEYNESIEPGAAIAVAGRSNGLGGALAANLAIPVFNCPPFKDRSDLLLNINSSLIMPSKTPAATVIDPESAALAALRSLNVPALKRRFAGEIRTMKQKLFDDDALMRGR